MLHPDVYSMTPGEIKEVLEVIPQNRRVRELRYELSGYAHD
jgi:hypothetical protein